MAERNESRYQLEQDNEIYILSTSLLNDKLKLVCKDSNSQKFIGEFSMNDLLNLSRYFSTARTIEQVQNYLNGIIEKQRVAIFPEDNIIKVTLYLVNNDKIIIPLNKIISSNYSNNTNNINSNSFNTNNIISNNNINNNYYEYENLFPQNQQNNINSEMQINSSNYSDPNFYTEQIISENISPSYIYQQNSNDYITNFISQPYYIDGNNSNISDIYGGEKYLIPEVNNASNIHNGASNTITQASKKIPNTSPRIFNRDFIQFSPEQNIIPFPQADASHINYNFSNEIKLDKLEGDTNIIKLEQEKIKKEMQRVLDEAKKLKKENEFYKNQNSSLLIENNALKNENENYRVELLNYQKEIKAYKDENDSIKNQFAAIQNNSNNFKNEKDDIEKFKEIYENENQTLKNNLEEINKENEMLKREIEELKQNLNNTSNENESLINEINALKESLENKQKTTINEEEIKKLIEENSIFRIKAQENEILKKQIEDLKNQIQSGQEGDEEDYEETQEVKGDIIHDMKELELLTKKINKDNQKIIINLLYKASADGDSASAFHEKCDQAKNTIVLVETKDGKRFGGYTSCSWSGNCIDKSDSNAFIFSFDKMKTYDNIPGDEAIGCYPKFGPIFLGCQIKIYDNAFVKGGTTFEKELNFNTQEDYELTGGERNFEVKDIEVYEVLFE